ncbi:hypothetical protein D3C87_2182780 [compost metagenome]
MTNAVVPVILSDGAQFVACRVDTGQMRCRFQTRAILDAFNNAVRPVALTGVRAVGH